MDLLVASYIHDLTQAYAQLILLMDAGDDCLRCLSTASHSHQNTSAAPLWLNLREGTHSPTVLKNVSGHIPSFSKVSPSPGLERQTSAPLQVVALSVSQLTHQINLLIEAVNLLNQMSSTWMLVRCAVMFVKLISLIYFFIMDRAFYQLVGIVDELLRSFVLCYLADDLLHKHKMLEDVVWKLHMDCKMRQEDHNTRQEDHRMRQDYHNTRQEDHRMRQDYHNTSQEDQNMRQEDHSTRQEYHNRLLFLAIRLGSCPAVIFVGSITVLGNNILLCFINQALTYIAIIYQYRPMNQTQITDF
ncbi:uncharacterized protein [Cherax quadricarinatus]|uniref:uncharacterized protein n=1 Tax=Cherax quadricarinatus TaxID=27406 RepID=UPI00387EB8B8